MGKKNTAAAEQDSSAAAATDAHTTPEQKEREDGQTEGRRRRTDRRPQSVRPSVRHIAVGGHVPWTPQDMAWIPYSTWVHEE